MCVNIHDIYIERERERERERETERETERERSRESPERNHHYSIEAKFPTPQSPSPKTRTKKIPTSLVPLNPHISHSLNPNSFPQKSLSPSPPTLRAPLPRSGPGGG